jgi:hypothetical protein
MTCLTCLDRHSPKQITAERWGHKWHWDAEESVCRLCCQRLRITPVCPDATPYAAAAAGVAAGGAAAQTAGSTRCCGYGTLKAVL